MKKQTKGANNDTALSQIINQKHEGELPSFTELAKTHLMHKYGMSEQQWADYDAEVSLGLLTLRTAYPTQARNFTNKEHDMLTALWLELFAQITPGILQKAIMLFIAGDSSGFFPSPGQVMKLVVNMQAEHVREEAAKRAAVDAAEFHHYLKRIENGENCSTCISCEKRDTALRPDAKGNNKRLYCQNPNSYKYEGHTGHGTAASIVCDYYQARADY